jgi:hypothetical protein
MRRRNACAGVNARFTKVFQARSKHVAVFDAAPTRNARAVTSLKINGASRKSARLD